MKEKTQYEALMEELQKIVENFRDGVIEIGERLSKLLPDIEIREEEEDTWEMKCPYSEGNEYYYATLDGSVYRGEWENSDTEKRWWEAGNIFPTKEVAELEFKRKKLLTRFRAFRDECNEDWKPKWNDNKPKYFLFFDANHEELQIDFLFNYINSHHFGYFEKSEDAERAIELFGDEIKELFVDCEV